MRTCDICGKHTMYGNKVSNSYNHVRRTWKPNLLKIKTMMDGQTVTLKICTQCLRKSYENCGLTKKINVVPANKPAEASK